MTTKTEGQHTEEFLVSEAPGALSREKGTLASGQTVVDGQAVMFSTGKLVAAAGAHNTAGESTEDIAGIVCGAHTVTADTPVTYIARLAEVQLALVTLHTGGADSTKQAAVKAALAAQFIVTR